MKSVPDTKHLTGILLSVILGKVDLKSKYRTLLLDRSEPVKVFRKRKFLGLKVEAVQGKQDSLEWTETSGGL